MNVVHNPRSPVPGPRNGLLLTTLVAEGPLPVPVPVTVGVPFPRGLATIGSTLRLYHHEAEVWLQTHPLACWPDGSIKWMLLDYIADASPSSAPTWSLWLDGPLADRPDPAGITVNQRSAGLVVATDAAEFHFDRSGLFPRVRLRSGLMLAPCRVVLVDDRGRPRQPLTESVACEAGGPVRATVRIRGRFHRCPCRFDLRLSCFADSGLLRAEVMLHNPRRAWHRGGLWDLGDPGSFYFRSFSVEYLDDRADEATVYWLTEPGHEVGALSRGRVLVHQDSSGGDNWNSRNHVNRHGVVPCAFQGYRVDSPRGGAGGRRARPTVRLQKPGACVTVVVPEFWEQFPKAVAADSGRIRVGLFPGESQGGFELQGGERKRHTVWFDFASEPEFPLEHFDGLHAERAIRATPDWYAASGAFERLRVPRDAPDDRLDSFLGQAVAGERSLFARREIIDEYGWRNYGEVYADHEGAYHRGPTPIVSHYNNQYDLLHGAIRQWLGTGDNRWFRLLDPLARHVMDIDIYHTAQDRSAYNGGLFWHTDHYRDAGTATHRAYARAGARGQRSYGGGPSSEHNYTTGLMYYYYLTGDDWAREAVLSLAEWVIRMDDGRRTVLGLLDPGPTGLASRTVRDDYHGPGRGCGNSVNSLLDAWLMTGERRFLNFAEHLIRRSIHPADDVTARRLLDVEARWSYTVFLSVLARYLSVKEAFGETDAGHEYARASLVHYGRWMLENELPYFDQVEKLEYPTETWGAQELRKGNVLRLAAQYVGGADSEAVRSAMWQRGGELAERGWSDMLCFPQPATARALALVLLEGPCDRMLRRSLTLPHSNPLPLPHPNPLPVGEGEGGTFVPRSVPFAPVEFVPQRLRVRDALRRPGVLARMLAGVFRPGRWLQWRSARRGHGEMP